MDERRLMLVKLFQELSVAFQEMSDGEFSDLATGDLRLSFSFEKRSSSSGRKKETTKRISEEKLREVRKSLLEADSREDGYSIVSNEFRKKVDLFAFAKFLDLPVQKNDTVGKIREKIVTYTVGRRLGGDAIRGKGW